MPGAIVTASFTLTLFGIVACILLINNHRNSASLETDDTVSFFDTLFSYEFADILCQANYLEKMYHQTYGFAFLGCIYSLPKVFLYWSAGLAVMEAAYITASLLPASNLALTGALALTGTFVTLAALPAVQMDSFSRSVGNQAGASGEDEGRV